MALALDIVKFEPFGKGRVHYLSELSKRRAHLVWLLVLQGKRMVDCVILLSLEVAGEDLGPLRPRFPGFCPRCCFPHTPPVLVSGTGSWGCGRDEWTMCPVHLCPQCPAQCLAQGSPP